MNATVRRVQPGDASLLKTVRLAALAESPSAFGSTYAAEADLPDDHWAGRAAVGATGGDSVTYFAVVDQSVAGLVGGYRPDPAESSIELVSMWVAPAHRRAGVAANLVQAILRWASDNDIARVELWVTRGNTAAMKLYEDAGFEVTGDYQPLPSDPCKDELRMRRVLG